MEFTAAPRRLSGQPNCRVVAIVELCTGLLLMLQVALKGGAMEIR